MKKTYLLLIILFLGTLTNAQTAKEIAKNCLPSTVSLVMEDKFKQPISLGSGFVLENDKVVTNLHVIEGAKYGYVLENGNSKKHIIEGYYQIDKTNDLAILSVPTLTAQPLTISSVNKPEIGEKIYAIGNPKGLSGTISEGIVSGIRSMESKELIQITAPISPGSSGGPVINNKGEVVGVAVGTLTSGQNLNFAIPVRLLKELSKKGTGSITSLNISKGATAPKVSKNEIDVKEGIQIRDWKYDYPDQWSGRSTTNIKSISLRNRLPHPVKKIKLLFVLFDRSGIPVDYFEKTYFDSWGSNSSIKPFLAKTIEFDAIDWHKHRALRKEKGENLEVRVLDFELIKE